MIKTILFILVGMLFFTNEGKASPADGELYWKKLLHFHGNESEVVSDEFFLSPNGRYDPLAEESVTIEMLNGEHGQAIACNFPARYTWLKSVHKLIPDFDLYACVELQDFLTEFAHESLSIVFVSEFADAPASAFGHIMLLFQDARKPAELADTISYSAITKSDSFMSYAYRGLTGKYDGYFIRAPYFKKKNEYTVSEQRALHRYALNLTQTEISNIVLHLYELRKARFHYYFIKQNCAYQVGGLLNIAFQNEERGFELVDKVLPIDVVRKYTDHISSRTIEAPSLLKAEQLLGMLSLQEKASVEAVIEHNTFPSVELSDQVKEVLALDYQYAFRRRRTVLNHYESVQSLSYQPSNVPLILEDPLYGRDSSRVKLGWIHYGTTDAVMLGYRPMLRDIYALQQNALQESELSLLNVAISAKKPNDTRVEQLDVIKLRSLPTRNVLRRDVSWSLYAGANRLNKYENFFTEAEGGVGWSGGSHPYTMSLLFSSGLQSGSGARAYLKPDIGLFGYVAENMKLGFQSSLKMFTSTNYLASELFLSVNLAGSTSCVLKYTQTSFSPNKLVFELNLPI